MKLSILIPSLTDRSGSLERLETLLNKQTTDEVEILTLIDSGELNIGAKRNILLDRAEGQYVAFIDDDDLVSSDYIPTLLKAIEHEPDCVSLRGVMTWDGQNPEIFEHSIKYDKYLTTDNPIKYERFPNHLNCIKASIAKQFKFPEKSFGEDTDWAVMLKDSGLLKKEIFVDKILYHYLYRTK